ncbi:GNAT family N-acetyltransferase [Gimesia aquarii]|uniref:Acetyltransferase (GNAT) family protein n=1 Tax=Gimesia aquarii TaxID=2527964 RepID=A0A517VXU2_9PLAN|nr:GNAT family N-acetyltransferase [Gimesia aquarii]QDT97808.1 Acetyltransferase (GNAT) family protein [Gimesia aquarii]
MIRTVTPEDTDSLIHLAEEVGLFSPDELEDLRQMLVESLTSAGDQRPLWITDDDNGLVGVAYCEPERMTEGTWNLLLIAVHPSHQKQGRGEKLIHYVEQTLSARAARILLVETSGTPDFEYVREFYRKKGFDEEARIRDFYAEGMDKVIFRKELAVQR